MRLLPWVIGLYLPLCATQGAQGIPAPGLVDLAHFARAKYSTVLIAPQGFNPPPDMIAPSFPVPAAKLFAAMQAIAAAEPRTYALDAKPGQYQAAYVVRSRAFNFPDVVEIAVVPQGPARSSYFFYSHSLYGWYAYGVNKSRAKTWAAALQQQASK
jgi:uncharacterized protein (DUF1499 family)